MSLDKEIQCELVPAMVWETSLKAPQTMSSHRDEMLQMFRQQRHFIDVVLVLEDKEFLAHSTVLAAFSPTLFIMLINPTETNHKNQAVINLDSFNISLKSLDKIVDFMYDRNFECLLDDVSPEDLKKDAHFLGISQIVEYINHHSEGDQRNTEAKRDSVGLVTNGAKNTECIPGNSQKKTSPVGTKKGTKHNTRKRKREEASNPGKEMQLKKAKFEGMKETVPLANSKIPDVKQEQLSSQRKGKSTAKNRVESSGGTSVETTNQSVSSTNRINTSQDITNSVDSIKKETTEEMILDTLNKVSQDIVQAAILATVSDILPDTPLPNNTTESNTTEANSSNKDAPLKSTLKTLDIVTTYPAKTSDRKEDDNIESCDDHEDEQEEKLAQWDEYCIDGEYVCPHCPDQKWKYLNKLCHHMIHVHGEKPFECFQCGKKFATKKHFTQHLKKHTGIKSYVCTIDGCERSFQTSRQLGVHRKAHSKKASVRDRPTYSCPIADCGEIFRARYEQDSHLLAVHPESKSFSCPHCTVSWTTHSQLRKHMHSHTEDRMVVCEECGKIITKKNLNEHLLTHIPGSRLQCQYCTYGTQHKRYMDSHMKRRHRKEMDGKDSLKMHKCTQCSFSTFFASDLKTHKKKHQLEAMLTCDVCPYKTSNVTLMKAHKRTHTNERPYICQICTKGFRQSTHLNRHSRLHTGDRPFVCTLCGRGFLDKRGLMNHQYNDHANVNQFLCHLCPFECVKQETLRIHMKKSHGIETFIMNEKKNRRGITVTGKELVIHDRPQYEDESDSNRMDPLIGDLKQMKEVVSDLVNLIPTTVDEPEPLESLLENPVPIDQSESTLDEVMDRIDQSEHPLQNPVPLDQSEPPLEQVIGIDQSENPLQEVIGNIDQSEAALPIAAPSLDQSQSSLQNPVPDQSDPDSNRILAEDDVKLISKALQKGNVVLHFV